MIQNLQNNELPEYYLNMIHVSQCPKDRKFFENGYRRMTGEDVPEYPKELREASRIAREVHNRMTTPKMSKLTGLSITLIDQLINRYRPSCGVIENAKQITEKLRTL